MEQQEQDALYEKMTAIAGVGPSTSGAPQLKGDMKYTEEELRQFREKKELEDKIKEKQDILKAYLSKKSISAAAQDEKDEQMSLIKLGNKDELPKGTANFLNTVLGNVYQNT